MLMQRKIPFPNALFFYLRARSGGCHFSLVRCRLQLNVSAFSVIVFLSRSGLPHVQRARLWNRIIIAVLMRSHHNGE